MKFLIFSQLAKMRCPIFIATIAMIGSVALAEKQIEIHEEIDRLIAKNRVTKQALPASDTQFLRRVYLDFIGRIPSLEEVNTFRANDAPDKRQQLVDKLIKSKECDRNLAIVFDVMLMERHPDKHVTTAEWRKYLRDSFANNKPYDQIAREILSSDGADPVTRPSTKFFLDRSVETHAITQDVSRMFLGRDIECAQCHDHPLVDDYLQSEYFGIFGFLNRSSLFLDPKDKKTAFLTEKPDGETTFSSVFVPDAGKFVAIPQLPNGVALDREPRLEGDAAYQVKPAKDVRPIPSYSRRQQLAQLATQDTNEVFSKNIANRLWAHMMGRGLVHPVDLHHSDNPPSNPKLLQVLSEGFVKLKFDTKKFLQQIALSETYQTDVAFAAELNTSAERLAAQIHDLEAQQKEVVARFDRLDQETKDTVQFLDRARKQVASIDAALEDIKKKSAAQTKSEQEALKARKKIEDELNGVQKVASHIKSGITSTQQALETQKNDQDLLAAKASLDRKSQAVEKELASLSAKQADLQKNLDSINQSKADLAVQQQSMSIQRDRLVDNVGEARGVVRYLQAKLAPEDLKKTDLAEQIAYVKQFLNLSQLTENVSKSKTKYQQFSDDLAAAQTHYQSTKKHWADTQSEVDSKAEQLSQISQLIEADKRKVSSKKKLIEEIQSAAKITSDVAAQLDGDQELTSVADKLSNRITSFQQEITSLNGSISDRDIQSRQLQDSLQDLENQLEHQAEKKELANKAFNDLQQKLSDSEVELARNQELRAAEFGNLVESWNRRFEIKSLHELSPEQMAGSLIVALGMHHRFAREAESEWNSKNKDKKIDPHVKTNQIESIYESKCKSIESTFVSLYANSPGSPQDVFYSSVDQALFMANDGRISGWLNPAQDSLVDRLQKNDDSSQLAEELYLSVLSRLPAPEERQEVTDYLVARKDERLAAIKEMTWALLTSLEFRFNH